MKQEQFDALKVSNPLINELCEALGLEYDIAYYTHPDREKERLQAERKARHDKAVALANKYFENAPYLGKEKVLTDLQSQFNAVQGEAVLNYWIGQKIISEGEGGLLFLGKEVPDEHRIKPPLEKANFLASELLAKKYMPKTDLLAILAHFKIQEPEKELEFWLNSKIVGLGYAVFGTNRQTRQEIVYLGNCPF